MNTHTTNTRRWVLNIGELAAGEESGVIVCHGLGSCIGLFLYDRTRKVGGGAHIFLPGSGKEGATEFAENAFFTLLREMIALGCNPEGLRAKIIGGATVLSAATEIGERNARSVRKLIRDHKIFLASADTGGQVSRTGRFFLEDGSLQVSANNQTYTI
jgi:chemotaxis protein CheD